MRNKEGNITKTELIIINCAIIISILSFSFLDEIADVCDKLRYVFWVLALLVIYIQSGIKLNFTIKYMTFVSILFILLSQVFHLLGYYTSSSTGLARYIGFCALFYTVGYNFVWGSVKDIKKIFTVCFIGYLFLIITTIPKVNFYKDSMYLFLQKNQLGQILGSGIIIEAFFLAKNSNNKIIKMLINICSGFSLVLLMQIHSRTPLIALVVLAIFSFFSKKNKNQKDYLIAFGIVIAIILLITYLGGIKFIKELFEWDKNTNLNTVKGVNDLTSGRIEGYINAINDFEKNPIIGIGFDAYIDNFILFSLRSGGLLFAIFIIPFVYIKMYKVYSRTKHIKENSNEFIMNLNLLARNYTLYFFVISLMEGYPPVGPGTSVFLLWLIYGITDNVSNLKNVQNFKEDEYGYINEL